MTTSEDPRGGGRDRLRELLDAVLAEENQTLGDMARGAYASPFHFSRQLSRDAGEPPVAMRRRVAMERAAWQLSQGSAVTDVAFQAGYDSVEGFSRAFARAYGHPPSRLAGSARTGHWLPAPNGIHFHPPTSLWIEGDPPPAGSEVSDLLVRHDLEDTRSLLDHAKGLADADYRRVHLPGHVILDWDGPDSSIAEVLHHLVQSKEVWLAAIEGADIPAVGPTDAVSLLDRHEDLAPRWLAAIRDIDRRRAWGDRLVDALCDPPETFLLAGVLAHVLTFSAARRQLARQLLLAGGTPAPGDGDPLSWLQRRTGGSA